MSFWTLSTVTPKLKDRFIVKIAGSLNIFVKSVDKPTLTFDNKEYKMINHHFKYPGLPKWNSIKIVFVDMNGEGDLGENHDAAKYLLKLAGNSGFSNPDGQGSVSKIKSAAALGEVQIQQISTSGEKNKVIEEWKLINPIIKSIDWGTLAYGEDGLVEYTLELDYDYAVHSADHNIQGSSDATTEPTVPSSEQ